MGRVQRKRYLDTATAESNVSGLDPTPNCDASTDETKDGGSFFNAGDKRRVRKYLEDYRNGVLSLVSRSDDASVARGTGDTTLKPETSVRVAGIELPRLSKDSLALPYLALPSKLSFRQRQFVHECCIELTLYHCGMGERGGPDRFVAVSVYCDVFDHVQGFRYPDYLHFRKSFRPWFCRSDNSISCFEETQAFRERIQDLIDQPGSCIRDGCDTLNFSELEGEDLSNVEPPCMADGSDSPAGWVLIDTGEKMVECVKELVEGKPTEIAFDLEAYNPSKYCQLTCLLQVTSSLGKEYIIDTLAEGVWDNVKGLAEIFGDPTIIKVAHAIGGLDVRCLQRDFGIFICNVFDTYEAAKALQMPKHGLADVCKYFGLKNSDQYMTLKAKYQTTDWRQRPLTDQMILYGRYDVHYLLKLRKLMMRDLTYTEIFSDGYAESKLVAESLAITLKRIQDFEDGIEYETASEDGSLRISVTAKENFESEQEVGVGVEDIDSQRDRSKQSDRDAFFTPENSTSFDQSDEDSSFESYEAEDKIENVKSTKIATAHVLRMQPRLMRVLSQSQEHCLDFWTGRAEPHYRNAVFVSLMQQAKQTKEQKQGNHQKLGNHQNLGWPPLTQSQIKLYEDLVHLRAKIAKKGECLPGFLCSLDDMARIASGRPTNSDALRIISYFLPERLSENSFIDQIFVLTKRSLMMDAIDESPFDAAVRMYHCKSGESKGGCQKQETWLSSVAKRVLLASAALGGIYVAVVVIMKKRRK